MKRKQLSIAAFYYLIIKGHYGMRLETINNSYDEHVDNDEQDQYCSGLILENTRSIKMAPNELRKTRKIIQKESVEKQE